MSSHAQAALPKKAALSLTFAERRVVVVLAGIYATRMLGLFLLLPVLAIHASQLPDATPTLIGAAMGAYGLTQAIFQIPFGRWSDRYGRRPLIMMGLSLFLAGSVVGALAHSVLMVILARSLQGAGAMSAAVTALLADSTREEVRTRAMAFIGISIGASFVVSLMCAPLLASTIGVPGIFGAMALLAVLGMALLKWGVPGREDVARATSSIPASLWQVVELKALRPYFIGVFALHFILTATFLAVPLLLLRQLGVAEADHWKVYLGVFLTSLLGTVPLILASERVSQPQRIVALAVLVSAVAQMGLAGAGARQWAVYIAFTVFFAAFNFLEARLPASLSKAAPAAERGAAMGWFSTCQFLGAACGGAMGGVLLGRFGIAGVFCASAVIALVWAGIAAANVAATPSTRRS